MSSRATTLILALTLSACVSTETALNQPPVARAGLDLRAIRTGKTVYVELDGGGSVDPDGDALEYRWEIVRAPDTLFLGNLDRKAERPVIGLSGTGLYVFSLTVRDPWSASAPDFVNVWVVDGLLLPDVSLFEDWGVPDVGVGDGGLDGGEDAGVDMGEDAGVDAAEDAWRPDTPIDAEPDAARGDMGEDQPPIPVFDLEDSRPLAGTPVRLSGARSRDDGGQLTLSWRLESGPEGAAAFEAEGVAALFTPTAPGLYTLSLTADDGAQQAQVTRALYARGAEAWLLSPVTRQLHPFSRVNGLPLGEPVEISPVFEPMGFTARLGRLYVSARAEDRAPELWIAAPGRQLVRRRLPAHGAPSRPLPGPSGVWISARAEGRVFFTDPEGAAPLISVGLPEAFGEGFTGHAREGRLSLTSFSPEGIFSVDLAQRRAEPGWARLEDCLPTDVRARGEALLLSCRNQNTLARVTREHDGVIEPQQRIALPGGSGARAMKLALWGERAAVMHASKSWVSLPPLALFELPPEAPERAREAIPSVDLGGDVLDLISTPEGFLVLSEGADGGSDLTHLSPTGEILWSRRGWGPSGRFLAVDVGEDLQQDFDML